MVFRLRRSGALFVASVIATILFGAAGPAYAQRLDGLDLQTHLFTDLMTGLEPGRPIDVFVAAPGKTLWFFSSFRCTGECREALKRGEAVTIEHHWFYSNAGGWVPAPRDPTQGNMSKEPTDVGYRFPSNTRFLFRGQRYRVYVTANGQKVCPDGGTDCDFFIVVQ
jgi:hypothetical protein